MLLADLYLQRILFCMVVEVQTENRRADGTESRSFVKFVVCKLKDLVN